MAESTVFDTGPLREKFSKIKSGMETRIGRAMVVSAGGVLKSIAKKNLQSAGLVLSGSLLKNVVIKREASAPSGTAEYHLGVRHGRAKTKKQKEKSQLAVNSKGRIVYVDDPYYWKFPEFGTRHQPKKPFIAPALEQGKEAAIGAMQDRLQKELDKL